MDGVGAGVAADVERDFGRRRTRQEKKEANRISEITMSGLYG